MDGVTAAAIEAIVGAVFVLGRRAIFDGATAAMATATLLILCKSLRRIPEPVIVVIASVIGLVLAP